MEQFGKPPGDGDVEERPGAYGIAISEGRLLVVEFERRLYLPGGPLQPDETPEEALRREVLSETGHEIIRSVPVAQAGQFVHGPKGHYNKVCAFFSIEVGPKVRNYYSPGHSPEWVPLDDAVPAVAEEASLWALQRSLDLHRAP